MTSQDITPEAPPEPRGLDLSSLLPGTLSGQSAAFDQSQNVLTRGMSGMADAGMSQIMMTKGGDALDILQAGQQIITKKNDSWVDAALAAPDVLLSAALIPLGFGAMRWRVNAQGKLVPQAGKARVDLIDLDPGAMAPIREGGQALYNSTAAAALNTPEAMPQLASHLTVGIGPGERAGREWLATTPDTTLGADLSKRSIDDINEGLHYPISAQPAVTTALELRYSLYPGIRTAKSPREIGNAMAAPGGLADTVNAALPDTDTASVTRSILVQQYIDFVQLGDTAHLNPSIDTSSLQADLANNPQLAFDMAKEDLTKIQALWEKDFVSGQLGEEFVALHREYIEGRVEADSPQGERLFQMWKHLGTVAQAFPNGDIEFRSNPHIRAAQVGLAEDGAYILMAVTNRGVMIDKRGKGDLYTTNVAYPMHGRDSELTVKSYGIDQVVETGKPVRYVISDQAKEDWEPGYAYLGIGDNLETKFDIEPFEPHATNNVIHLIGHVITDGAEYAGQPNPAATTVEARQIFLKQKYGDDVDLGDPNIIDRLWGETVGTDTNRYSDRDIAFSQSSYALYSMVVDWVQKKSGKRWTADTYQQVFGMLSLRAELYAANLPAFVEWALGWQEPEIRTEHRKTKTGTREVEVATVMMSKAGKELGHMFTNLGAATDVDAHQLMRDMDDWYNQHSGSWEPEIDPKSGSHKAYTLMDDNVARTSRMVQNMNDGEFNEIATYDDWIGRDPETGEITGPMRLADMMYQMVVYAEGTAAEKKALKESMVRKTWNKANMVKDIEEGTYKGTLPDNTIVTYDTKTGTFELGAGLTGEKIRTFGPASAQVGQSLDGQPITVQDLMGALDILYQAPSDVMALTVNDTHQIGALMGVGIPGDNKAGQFGKMLPYQVMTRAILNGMRLYPDVFRNAHSAQAFLWSPWRDLTGTKYRTVLSPDTMRDMQGRSDDPLLNMDTINDVSEDAMLPINELHINETMLTQATGFVYRDSNGRQMYLVREGHDEMHPGWVVMPEYEIKVNPYKARKASSANNPTARQPAAGDSVVYLPAVPRSARVVGDVTREWQMLRTNTQSGAGEPSRIAGATLHQHTMHSAMLRSGGWTRLMHLSPPQGSERAMKNIIDAARKKGIPVPSVINDAFQSKGYSTPYLVPDWGKVSELVGFDVSAMDLDSGGSGANIDTITPEQLEAVIQVIPEAGTLTSWNADYGTYAEKGLEFDVTEVDQQQLDVYLNFAKSEHADAFIAFMYSDLQTAAPDLHEQGFVPESWNEGGSRPTPEGNGTRVIDLLNEQTLLWKMYSRDANDLPEHIYAFGRSAGVDKTYEPQRAYEYVATDGVQDVSYISGEGNLQDPNLFPVLVMGAPGDSSFSEIGDLVRDTKNVHADAELRPLAMEDINGRITWGNDLVLHAATESDVSRLYPDYDIEYVVPDTNSFLDVTMRRKKREIGAEWEDMDPPTRIAMYLPKADQVPIIPGDPTYAVNKLGDAYLARQQVTSKATHDIPEVAFDHDHIETYMVKEMNKPALRTVDIRIERGENKMPMYHVTVPEGFPLVGIQAKRLLVRSGIRPSRIRLRGAADGTV